MISTIGQLFNHLGMSSRIFDLGRHIRELDSDTFAQCEAHTIAYPTPYLHHAWLGLLFWDPATPEVPLLWFIKLPLDEQGKLVPAERDRFIKQLLIALGNNLEASKQGQQLAAVLDGNPFVFTPTPERQAAIHARVNLLLQRPVSNFYQPACDYLQGDLQHWQHLGLQGLADLAVRWQEHQAALVNAIATMPDTPLASLCQCLENEALNGSLGKALQSRLQQALDAPEPNALVVAALVRGLSQCRAQALRQKALTQVLNSRAAEQIEVLAALATRCGDDLCQPELALAFLEALSRQGQHHFNRVLADLLFNPDWRPHILASFRAPQRSAGLSQAIGGLLNPPTPGTDHSQTRH